MLTEWEPFWTSMFTTGLESSDTCIAFSRISLLRVVPLHLQNISSLASASGKPGAYASFNGMSLLCALIVSTWEFNTLLNKYCLRFWTLVFTEILRCTFISVHQKTEVMQAHSNQYAHSEGTRHIRLISCFVEFWSQHINAEVLQRYAYIGV